MSITLTPSPDTGSLRITGNIESQLAIPADSSFVFGGENYMHAYYIALSDGTLLRALRFEDPQWEVVIEGAGTIEIDPSGKTLTVHWGIEWVTLTTNCNASAVAQQPSRNLPLFHPELSQLSAIA